MDPLACRRRGIQIHVQRQPDHDGELRACAPAGSPIVTFPGELIIGRVREAGYCKMSVRELVVDNPQAYIDQAVQVATDRDYYPGKEDDQL
jgi:hypothetical protein